MDTFMDRLAEKLNAQEMIRANTSAELEELGAVKEQISELKDCVSKIEAAADRIHEDNCRIAENVQVLSEDARSSAEKETQGRDEDLLYILEEEISQLGKDLSEFRSEAVGRGGDGNDEWNSHFREMEAKLMESAEATGRLREDVGHAREDVGHTREEVFQLREVIDQLREEIDQFRDELTMDQAVEPDTGEQEKLVRESSAEIIREVCNELTQLEQRLSQGNNQNSARNTEAIAEVKRLVEEMAGKLNRGDALASDQRAAAEKQLEAVEQQKQTLEGLSAAQAEGTQQLMDKMTGVHEALREGFHKECVKVYRNVQAAFVEENEKQTAILGQPVEKLQSKLTVVTILAGLALLTSVAGIVLQVLQILKLL